MGRISRLFGGNGISAGKVVQFDPRRNSNCRIDIQTRSVIYLDKIAGTVKVKGVIANLACYPIRSAAEYAIIAAGRIVCC